MKLLAGVLLLLLHSTCLAEVVNDFTQSCPQFFPTLKIQIGNKIRDTLSPPTRFTGPRYKEICQTRNNQKFFDTQNKIPVYSAFRFNGHQDCDRSSSWFIEPQLDNATLGKDMARLSAVTPRGVFQALNSDYAKSGYDRGHLVAVYQTNTNSCADATFTLTNAAPQHYSFNSGQWKRNEKEMADLVSSQCVNLGLRAYDLTGVVPGNNALNNTTVRIPSHFWTAYCCTDQNNKHLHSGAYIGENVNVQVNETSVDALEEELTDLYENQLNPNTKFTVFNGGCYT